MLKKILIANRSEIALRIQRTCREMGIETVTVHSTADRESLHAQFATQSVCIGGPKAADSYLNMENIITAALETGCDGIHPGYGFLSENSQFAALCAQHGLIFIGPSADIIAQLGNKASARALMMEHGVPVVPGSSGTVQDGQQALEIASQIGYPVLVKASAGGGGRGMRRIFTPEECIPLFQQAKAEALSCFGSDEMYLEKLILNPKHVEVQIMADHQGNVVHLGERDCSVQRRNQKLIEESPCKVLDAQTRARMTQDAVKAAKAVGYTNAGTIEFVLDGDGNYYFIEMNTRIQVEHPVTEMVTGVDLIKEQIRVAGGLPLSISQDNLTFTGHAIECRINAENPWDNFTPSMGTIDFLHLPGGLGVRVETAIYQGYEISPFYDSMVAKIVVCGDTRLSAIRKMRRCLAELVVEGLCTNERLHQFILHSKDFLMGGYDTSFIETHYDTFAQLNAESQEE